MCVLCSFYMAMSNASTYQSIDLIRKALAQNFSFEPTPSQEKLMEAMARFVVSAKPNCLLTVKGYAGTGKTTLVSALVKSLGAVGLKSVLLAPTGRAAKVLGSYSGVRAYTIHKKIYFRRTSPDGSAAFELARNLHTHTVFVVDEASMIGNDSHSGSPGSTLLEDLMGYVFNGLNCRLLLIGDGAQLPPVGSEESPALDLKLLGSSYPLTAALCELSDVTRQSADSGILEFATAVRASLWQEDLLSRLPFKIPAKPDVVTIDGTELQDHLESAFAKYGEEGTLIITRSNKRANLFNQSVRARVFFREEVISGGDLLMVVKNNYHWLGDDSKAGFIANGDVVEVMRLGNWEERYGFKFVHATLRMVDYPDELHFEALLWLDTIDVEGASMPREAQNKMYSATLEAYSHLKTREERKKAVKDDPFFNALQVKFAYAVTCHKSQGGQWPVVFVDQGYLVDDMIDNGYLRWLYTAITRASEKLYLLNFSPKLVEVDG